MAQPHQPQALYLLGIATKNLKTRIGPLDNMPTYSEKKRAEFALASAPENVALATALRSGDEGDESSGKSLVKDLILASRCLSSIRYLNPCLPNSSAIRYGDAVDIIYNYTDVALRLEFRMNRDMTCSGSLCSCKGVLKLQNRYSASRICRLVEFPRLLLQLGI